RSSPGLEDFWQLHASLNAPDANMPAPMIANLDESTAHVITLSAQRDGSFTVTNGRTNETRRYGPRYRLSRLFDPVQRGLRAEIARASADGRRRHEARVPRALGQHLERAAGLDHRRPAVLAEEVDPAFGEQRRRRVGVGDARVPDFIAGLRIETGDDAAVVDHEEEAVPQQHRRFVGRAARSLPGHGAIDPYGEPLAGVEAGRVIHQPVSDDRTCARRELRTFFQPPQFPARERIVGVRRL